MTELREFLKQFNDLKIIKTSSSKEVFIYGVSNRDYPKKNTIIFLKNKKFLEKVKESKFLEDQIFVIEEKLIQSSSDDFYSELQNYSVILQTPSVDRSMTSISKYFFDLKQERTQCLLDGRQTGTVEIHPTVEIAQNVFIGDRVSIQKNVKVLPGSVIMPDVTIGEGTVIFPNVTIYPDTFIGENVIIHSGSVIGSDGFGYQQVDGKHKKVFHLGSVEIKNNVEIGANCTIDRGTFGPTIIGEGSKLDNMVHIAHNCLIGESVVVCGQTGIAGSAIVEDYVMISGNVGIGPGVKVGAKSQVGGNSAVTGDLAPGNVYSGYPARPLREWLRAQATLRRLTKK